ncbi:FAD-dependent oxidoreductase [Georgenia daeguensis]|uniref:Flavocytochrome c n=1 Tax=Georgenia daeguensis TaxID=908355 RepID=A0ABP8EUH7_9MICO
MALVDGSSWDVVVLGGGLAGLRAASVAAAAGASVVLLEKQDRLGGSSALSAGMFWTAPDLASYHQRVPDGDRELAARLIAEYETDLADIRASGVNVDDEPTLGVMGDFGRGYSFDVRSYLGILEDRLRARGGEACTGVRTLGIERTDDGRFLVRTETAGGRAQLRTSAVVLATGGFQASPELRAAHMPAVGADIVLRSNPGSEGDGLRLATSLGAGLAGDLGTFYGHLVPHPVTGFTPDRFMLFSQYYSSHGILVAADGRRFAEESRGDEILNQDLAEVDGMTAFLLFDDEVRSTYGVSEPFANFGRVDRFELAVAAGARHATAGTLGGLVRQLGALGVDADQLTRTLAGDVEPSRLARRVSRAAPPTTHQLERLRRGPFYALEVQPAITFTLGGIAIDPGTSALDRAGARIDGLYAAGADIGGFNNYGYAGGLAPAHLTGSIAGRAAARRALGALTGAHEGATC